MLATTVAVSGIVAAAVGRANPWHLVQVDRWLYHPWLAGCVALAAAWMIWHLNVRSEHWRTAILALLLVASLAWPVVGVGLHLLDTYQGGLWVTAAAANERNDVQAHLTADITWWTAPVILGADRGRASRSHIIERVGYIKGGDSGPPPLELEFTAADELTVTYDGHVVYA